MAEIIAANYVYTFERYFMLTRARRQRDRTRWTSPYTVVPVLSAIVLLADVWYDGKLAAMTSNIQSIATLLTIVAASMLATCVLVYLIDLLFDKVIYRLVFKRYASANKHITIEIGDVGIHWTARDLSGQLAWAAIKSITVLSDGSAAVAWLGKIEGLLLPTDGFSSPADFGAAIMRIKEKCHVR
jgi:hypothetical protein